MKFTGSNVLITGASRGIGAAIAKTLASFGLKVWINYRSGADAAEKVKEEIEKAGGNAAIIKADVTNEEELKNTLFYLTGKVAQSLRKKGWEASTIDIKLRYTDFQTLTRAKTIMPSDDDKIIFETAWDLMKKVLKLWE